MGTGWAWRIAGTPHALALAGALLALAALGQAITQAAHLAQGTVPSWTPSGSASSPSRARSR